jgi:hypothetical protein
MMPYQSYQLWQIERPKTAAEQYAADLRRGLFAAAVSRSARQAARKTVRLAARSRPLFARAVRRPVSASASGGCEACEV